MSFTLRLCGTKLGCGEGGCGACTVMVSKFDRSKEKVMYPLKMEGIGSTKTQLHPVQKRIAEAHGSQCGFCTPGIVMSMYTLLRNMPKPSMKDMEIAFQGYRPIIEGFRSFTEDWEQNQVLYNNQLKAEVNGAGNGCSMGENCCKNKANGYKAEEEVLFNKNEYSPYDPSQEPIFPSELRPNQITELISVAPTQTGLRVGAAVTLSDMESALRNEINSQPEYKTRIFQAIVDMLHWFAGKQIRNVGAVGGNIMTSSPISDLNPIFNAARCQLELHSKDNGIRFVKMDHTFFTGYRKTVVKPNEVLVAITIPYTNQAKRRDDDIAIVNLAANVEFRANTNIVKDIDLAFGGMAPTTVLAVRTKAKATGKEWNEKTLEEIYSSLIEDLPLDPSAPVERIWLANTEVPSEQKQTDLVGRPIVHRSAFKQATAVYCDDMPHFENELYLALVLSTKAHAEIVSIDSSQALDMEGVHAFFSAKDLSGPGFRNNHGIIHDDEVFALDKVTTQGQVIGAVVAEDQAIAQRAAKLVKVVYKDLDPVIITIEGDVDAAFKSADHVLESEARMGGQEHFYLETHCTIAVPKGEDDEMELFCSTQNPTETQKVVAEVLGIQSNKVVCRVKRMGGGFGGKESRILNRPVRCMLDRDEDMMISGTRHPFLGKYKVAFTKEGKITGCDIEIYNNGGHTLDLSGAPLEYCTIRRCWDECLSRSDYNTRKKKVEEFNRQNRWKKRGLSVVPTKFGISYTLLFLNQSGALVHIYDDGSVLISHGGTEMGQGLHTKMIQNACETIIKRLEPIKAANPKGTWADWIKTAYMSRVSLSATGFYSFVPCSTPGIGYDITKNEGRPFKYFTYGVACSEVEIDCLTGDHQAVGEPPLFLASSIFFAIKEAILSARKNEKGLKEMFRLDSPATAARIRMACIDNITAKFPEPEKSTYTPWNIVP
ncbi:Xanthine dehydrogenase/oxidase [Blattella germanica]|nr:Xanthine dehydrogenase/oxidase [Blattella germanica]